MRHEVDPMPTPQPRWAPARRVSVPPFTSITGARPGWAAPSKSDDQNLWMALGLVT